MLCAHSRMKKQVTIRALSCLCFRTLGQVVSGRNASTEKIGIKCYRTCPTVRHSPVHGHGRQIARTTRWAKALRLRANYRQRFRQCLRASFFKYVCQAGKHKVCSRKKREKWVGGQISIKKKSGIPGMAWHGQISGFSARDERLAAMRCEWLRARHQWLGAGET